MNCVRWIMLLVTTAIVSGCFQVTTVVRVNQDGSGTVAETMLLSNELVDQMNAMARSFAVEGGPPPKPIELFEPAKLEAHAARMGEGVTYQSGQKMESGDYSGYTAVYAFSDINNLRLDQNNDGSVNGPENVNPPAVFRFTRGEPATLIIEMPNEKRTAREQGGSSKRDESAGTADNVISEEQAKQVVEMFKGMRMTLAVEMNGCIVETNASYRDGNRITLVDLDLAELTSSFPHLEKLNNLQGGSLAEAKELLKDFPGMKIDLNETVKVVFRQ